jgi:hypothetical protein
MSTASSRASSPRAQALVRRSQAIARGLASLSGPIAGRRDRRLPALLLQRGHELPRRVPLGRRAPRPVRSRRRRHRCVPAARDHALLPHQPPASCWGSTGARSTWPRNPSASRPRGCWRRRGAAASRPSERGFLSSGRRATGEGQAGLPQDRLQLRANRPRFRFGASPRPLARHVQDRLGLAKRPLQHIDRLRRRQDHQLDMAVPGLESHWRHDRQSAVGPGADHQPAASPGDLLLQR